MKIRGTRTTRVVGVLQMKEFLLFLSLVTSCPFDEIIINNLLNPINDDPYKHEYIAIH